MQVKNVFAMILCVFGCFFCTTCGLETIVIVAPPVTSYGTSLYSTVEPNKWYCDFVSSERNNGSLVGASFIGTEVYYKIYNNYSTLESHRNAISSVNTETNNTAAATKVTETYGYQKLDLNPDQNTAVFLPEAGMNRRVYFRLKSYVTEKGKVPGIQYRAAVACPYAENESLYYGYDSKRNKILYKYTSETDKWTDESSGAEVKYEDIQFVVPYRTVSGSDRSFDFFDDNDTKLPVNSEPAEGDIDYQYNSSGFSPDYENTYFVQLYAIGVALDQSSCANTYSLVLDLGTIPIKKN